MQEIWKDVVGYEGLYQVSNTGLIKRLAGSCPTAHTDRIVKATDNGTGYWKIALCKNNIQRQYLVHRIVAQAFIPNPNNYDFVNHKDENKKNNNVDNLEWCTKSYNAIYYLNFDENRKIEYGKRFGGKSPMLERVPRKYLWRVIQKTKDGSVVGIYDNTSQASIRTGIEIGNITRVCKANMDKNRKRINTSNGFVWEFEIVN